MFRKITLAIFATMLLMPLAAQNNSEPSNVRSWFWISYGVLPLSDIASQNVENVSDAGGISKIGAFNIGYDYRINKLISVGGSVSYSRNKSKVEGNQAVLNWVSVMPTVKFNWLRKDSFSLYSRVGIGVMPCIGYDSYGDSFSATIFTCQLSPIGAEFGKNTLFFVEAGFGSHGTLMLGVRF